MSKGTREQIRGGMVTMSFTRRVVLGFTIGLLLPALVDVAAASAGVPWWHVTSASAPSALAPGVSGHVNVTATNVGDATGEPPITLSDVLPSSLTVEKASFYATSFALGPEVDLGPEGPLAVMKLCTVEPHEVACVYPAEPSAEFAAPPPFQTLELQLTVGVAADAQAGEVNEVTITGNHADGNTVRQPLRISGAETQFGFEGNYSIVPEEEGGAIDTRAGSHPFQLTTAMNLNRTVYAEKPPALVKDLDFNLPPGLVGNVNAMPQCTYAQFQHEFLELGIARNECPANTAVGVAVLGLKFIGTGKAVANYYVPVFNLTPEPGEPARFAFVANSVPVQLGTSVRTGGSYGVTVSIHDIPTGTVVASSVVTFWGVPGDSRHDSSRGWSCLYGLETCEPLGEEHPAALLTMPTSCETSFSTSVEGDSWAAPGKPSYTAEPASYTLPETLDGCNQLSFAPQIDVAPDVQEASTPTGLTVGVHIPQEAAENPEGIVPSSLRNTRVALPEGVRLDPSGADGLGSCGLEEIGFTGTEPGTGRDLFTPGFPSCPNSSKIATATIHTPLLPHPLEGSVYLATPYKNPFGSLLAVYLVAEDPVSGVLVKLAGEVSPNPLTGQLVSTFEQTPDLPFEDLELHFFGGDRAPLVTPPTCGRYTTDASFAPWSGNAEVQSDSSFDITSGLSGGPCPGGTPPFRPDLQAGTANNAAGTYSPFDIRLTRKDDEQEITHLSIKLPPGVTGRLAGIPFCPDADIAAAKAREGTRQGGQEEIDHPSCPAASEIGHTLVGAGVGSVLTYVPGNLYLAGPYNGSNLSIVAITPAVAGPFDLGTVVIREALRVNPETAEVFVDAADSDPIPHIIEGIPVLARDIRVYVDRPEFVKNPTSCEPTSTASTVLGSGTDFATEADDRPVTVTSRFQAADCASLGFRPRLKLMLRGSTRRAGLPRLKAVVTARPGDANIGRAVVTLPKSEFLEQAHIGTLCTRVQFNAGGGNGEQCPARSVYGHAVARTPLLSEPLEGPVFLRSNGGERKLPDMVAALHSADIDIDLVGFIKSLHPKGSDVSRIRSIFAAVPDAPVSRFTLEMFGGRKGLLINSANLCKGRHRAISTFVGQNGRRDETRPAVQVRCGHKHHEKARGHSRHVRRGGAHLGARRHGAR